MKKYLLSLLVAFIFLTPLNIVSSWFSDQEFTLFSLSYKNEDENDPEDGSLIIKFLYFPIYDEKMNKESAAKIKFFEEETLKNQQKIEMADQQIKAMQQKEIEMEELIKKTELDIQRKQVALQKMLSTI